MPKVPSPTKVHRLLQDIVKRTEAVELAQVAMSANIADLDARLKEQEKWHEQTEFAKKVLKEYQDAHPEATKDSLNTNAWKAVIAALAAITAAFLATR